MKTPPLTPCREFSTPVAQVAGNLPVSRNSQKHRLRSTKSGNVVPGTWASNGVGHCDALLWLFFVLVLSIAVLVLVIDAMRMLARAF